MAASAVSADNLGNRGDVEFAWAVKAYHHAETYFNLISSVDSRGLRLTKHDDELYRHFKQDFPGMKIDQINVEHLKSETAKSKWRAFCNHFDGTVDDFNFGTLLRLNSNEDYSEQNSLFVTRVQFFAIEVARNREGLNLGVRKVVPKTDEEALQSTKLTTPDTATQSDQVTTPDTATQSDQVTTPDTATHSDQVTTPDTATQSDQVTTPDTATQSDQVTIPDTATQSDQVTTPDTATQSDQVTS